MKTRKSVQIATVVFALFVLAAYVVYSQQQHNRSVAPSSKYIAITPGKEHPAVAIASRSNNVPDRERVTIAPGSKTQVPALTLQPTYLFPASNAPAAQARSSMIAPGSKSAPVFDPTVFELRPKEMVEGLTLNARFMTPTRATNITAPLKLSP